MSDAAPSWSQSLQSPGRFWPAVLGFVGLRLVGLPSVLWCAVYAVWVLVVIVLDVRVMAAPVPGGGWVVRFYTDLDRRRARRVESGRRKMSTRLRMKAACSALRGRPTVAFATIDGGIDLSGSKDCMVVGNRIVGSAGAGITVRGPDDPGLTLSA